MAGRLPQGGEFGFMGGWVLGSDLWQMADGWQIGYGRTVATFANFGGDLYVWSGSLHNARFLSGNQYISQSRYTV